MSALFQALIVIHVVANLVWVGSILGVAILLKSKAGEVRVTAPFAYELYSRLAVPAFVVSVIAGLSRLLLSTEYYFVDTKFIHPKLLFAAIVIALHHVIGARARAVSSGRRKTPGPIRILALMFLISAAAGTTFVIVKPFSHGATGSHTSGHSEVFAQAAPVSVDIFRQASVLSSIDAQLAESPK